MSTTENVSLEERVAHLQAELDKKNASASSGFVNKLKRVGRGIYAAFASTEAVKQEKSLAALVVTRLLVSAGASAATIGLAHQVLKQLGWA